MSTEVIFQMVLILATFLCSLVAGFLFAFASVVMPGINKLNDREFIRAFQVMDRVIQNNQPIFMFVWAGSVVALVTSVVLGIGQLGGPWLLIFAAFAYLFGVQGPTLFINIPLNNNLQTLNVDAMSETSQKTVREEFEPRWNQWNAIRTAFACLATGLLIFILFRL